MSHPDVSDRHANGDLTPGRDYKLPAVRLIDLILQTNYDIEAAAKTIDRRGIENIESA